MADAKTFADIVDESRRRNAEKSPWISVKERLPEELVPVLIYEPEYARGYKSMATAFRINGCWHGCVDGAVTHWMPLPELPEVEA